MTVYKAAAWILLPDVDSSYATLVPTEGEITVVILHRSFHLSQQVDCVFSNIHVLPPICHESSVGHEWLERHSFCPASEDGFLIILAAMC